MKRNCQYCGEEFETENSRKVFCCKAHCDRSRNSVYSRPMAVNYESVKDLRHFRVLSEDARQRVLLGSEGFSVVSFDIEATHLKANVGRILCCSFKPLGGEVYTLSGLDKGRRRADVYDDSILARDIRDELEKYDILVSWNGRMFDVKYVNARCVRAGERIKRPQYHVDGMWQWSTKTTAWRGLNNVQMFLDAEGSKKTAIRWEEWMRALGWNKKLRERAFAWITEHCERDVEVLERVYRLMVEAKMVRTLRQDGGML